jgi:hypothetical protein
MSSRSVLSVLAVAVTCAPLTAAQTGWSVREHVREHGRASIVLIACGPPIGLKEIVLHSQLTVEGTVASAESSLTPAEDDIYTDFVIDVIRLFRLSRQGTTRSTPGHTESSPFVDGLAAPRPTATTTLRVRLRKSTHGKVVLEGGVATASSGFPNLQAGQHIIVSAFLAPETKTWVPFGVFEVRENRVVPLPDQRGFQLKQYDSIEDFAVALADPPRTVLRR